MRDHFLSRDRYISKKPIFLESFEKRKMAAMLLMAFVITLTYEILRPIKTALIVTAAESGATIIPYLRTWVVLPSSILMSVFLSKLSRSFPRNQVFCFFLFFFLIFFLVFATVLYPYQETFEAKNFSEFLSSQSILKIKELLFIVRYWHLSLFYTFSELWATIILFILFWGYVNEITPMDDAKKIYGTLILAGNSSAILAGVLSQLFSSSSFHFFVPFGKDAWHKTVYMTLIFVLAIGTSLFFIFAYLNNLADHKTVKSNIKHGRNIKSLYKSFYLVLLALIVIPYNISYSLTEVLWTSKLHQLYPDPTQMSAYIGKVSSLTGVFSILFALFVYRQVIQQFGWTITALITPFIWLVTGAAFLLSIIFEENFFYQICISFLGLSPLAFIVLIGAVQLSLGKASEYSLFDQTKEMAFIPLSPMEQRTGKVWIEGVVTRIGKLSGGLIYQILLSVSYRENLVVCILCIFLVVVFSWIISVRALGNHIDGNSSHTTKLM